ncbi:MAG: 23S rRNA (guanosine(2251)-2'-O)-methyltransferase RlmB [Candidatus Coprovivens sp.]
MKVFGKNVFNELRDNVKSIKKVYIAKNFSDKDIIKFIQDNKISYSVTDAKNMDGMVEGRHQGIIAIIDDYEYVDYKTMLSDNVVVMLDHLEDPHNFGAIIRTCEAAGIKSIIIPKDRSVSVTSTVMKTSAGALEHVKIAMVNNLVNVIDDFKDNGFFVYAADMDGENYKDVDYASKVLLVIGSEGNGVGRLVKKNCDQILAIPMNGHVNSLNASVAAAILIYGIINRG